MHRITIRTMTVNQTTWMGLVVGIVLNDLTVSDTIHYFVKRQAIRKSFGVSVGRDLHPLLMYGAYDILYVHPIASACCWMLSKLTARRFYYNSSMEMQWQDWAGVVMGAFGVLAFVMGIRTFAQMIWGKPVLKTLFELYPERDARALVVFLENPPMRI